MRRSQRSPRQRPRPWRGISSGLGSRLDLHLRRAERLLSLPPLLLFLERLLEPRGLHAVEPSGGDIQGRLLSGLRAQLTRQRDDTLNGIFEPLLRVLELGRSRSLDIEQILGGLLHLLKRPKSRFAPQGEEIGGVLRAFLVACRTDPGFRIEFAGELPGTFRAGDDRIGETAWGCSLRSGLVGPVGRVRQGSLCRRGRRGSQGRPRANPGSVRRGTRRFPELDAERRGCEESAGAPCHSGTYSPWRQRAWPRCISHSRPRGPDRGARVTAFEVSDHFLVLSWVSSPFSVRRYDLSVAQLAC